MCVRVLRVYVRVCIRVWVFVCMCVCVCVCVCKYMCVCMMYVWFQQVFPKKKIITETLQICTSVPKNSWYRQR